MNQSDFDQLRAQGLRRRLTVSEREALEAWLAEHPEARPVWMEELALQRALDTLPEVPLSPQFTERVLVRIEPSEQAAVGRLHFAWTKLRSFLLGWRGAFVALAVAAVALGIPWGQAARERARLAESVAAMSALADLPELEALAEFDLVYNLPSGPLPDEQELARAFE